jgi:hypothetical protein
MNPADYQSISESLTALELTVTHARHAHVACRFDLELSQLKQAWSQAADLHRNITQAMLAPVTHGSQPRPDTL